MGGKEREEEGEGEKREREGEGKKYAGGVWFIYVRNQAFFLALRFGDTGILGRGGAGGRRVGGGWGGYVS